MSTMLPLWSRMRAGLFGMMAFACVGIFATGARGDLRFREPVMDLGEVRTGPPVAQRFAFANQGTHTIEITELRASCGCLTPHLAKLNYSAGEEGVVELEINTLSQAPGPHTWSVRVHYRSEGVHYETTLQLRARLISEVVVQPAALIVYADQVAKHEVTLTDLRARPLSITEVRASSPKLRPELAEPARDSQGHCIHTIHLDVVADYTEGRHDEVLAIYTDDPDYPEFKIPLTILQRSPQRLTALPAEVTLRAAQGQPIPSRIVLVRDTDDQAVTVEQVVADDPAIICQWAPGPNTMATVKIRVDPTRVPSGGLHSAVHVQISKPVTETITIPVTCEVH
jgi:hypothetical protein